MAKRQMEARVAAPAKQGTGWLLKMSWLNLIDSFGLSLIYINIHVFLRWVLGETLFCKLGEEWLPKKISQAGGDVAETAGRGIGIAEAAFLLLIDLAALLIVLALLGIFLLVGNIIENPLSYIGVALGMIWDATTGFFIGK